MCEFDETICELGNQVEWLKSRVAVYRDDNLRMQKRIDALYLLFSECMQAIADIRDEL